MGGRRPLVASQDAIETETDRISECSWYIVNYQKRLSTHHVFSFGRPVGLYVEDNILFLPRDGIYIFPYRIISDLRDYFHTFPYRSSPVFAD